MQTATEVIETIKSLPYKEKNKVFTWVEEEIHHSNEPETNGVHAATISYDFEQYREAHKWLIEHRSEYLNKWVCLEGGHLIAAGGESQAVYKTAKEAGVKAPYLHFVQKERPEFYLGDNYELIRDRV